MKVVYSLIATAMLVTQINASTKAQSHKDCEGFLPENDMYIGVDQQSNLGGLDEAQFNAVIDEVEAIYKPIVAAKGGTLNVKRLWTDGTVNASAQRQGSTYVVNMYGGLARHQAVTADGFALVVCHEIGHHIGGSPVYGGKPSQANGSGGWGGGGGGGSNSWASNEGQSDYFANTKCLRKVFRNSNNKQALQMAYNGDVPAFVQEKCRVNFSNEDDILICVRGAMAGMSLANLFKDLRRLPNDLSFETPDKTVVSRTSDGHPQPQCRLDTYFNGSVCEADDRVDLGYADDTVGACSRANGQTFGARPLCWYKPKSTSTGLAAR